MLDQLLRRAAERLAAAGAPSPLVDARLIAAHLLGVGHMGVHRVREEDLPAGFATDFEAALARREAREPLQHILGVAPFGHLDLAVGPGVFIPRPETEVLADWGVRRLAGAAAPTVVDLCTGSGALALYVATLMPSARVVAVEKQAPALDWARKNVERLAPQVELVRGDVTDPGLLPELRGTVDLILTNPPYVPETPELDPEVYSDPPEAVFAGADGMATIDRMTGLLANLLREGGAVGVEHDDSTSGAVQQALRAGGDFREVTALADLTGRPRFVTAVRGVSS